MPRAWVFETPHEDEIGIRVGVAHVMNRVFEIKAAILQGSLACPVPSRGSGLVFCREALAVYPTYPEASEKVRNSFKASGQRFFRQRGRNRKVRWVHPLGCYNIKRGLVRTGLSQFCSVCRLRPKFKHCTGAPGPNGATRNSLENAFSGIQTF